MQPPDFSVIHHIAIIVSDYQQARHFYVDILGLPIIRENYRAERQDYKLDLQLIRRNVPVFLKPLDCVILHLKQQTLKQQLLT